MGLIIESADNGNKAKVDAKGRLKTFSISEGYSIEAAELGESFNINTGSVSLTSATESSIAYFKNNEDKDFIIESIIIIFGSSTGGSGDHAVEIIKNPTAGTIISNAVAGDTVSNRNFGSAKSLIADFYKGVEGDTGNGGEVFASTTRSSASSAPIELDADVIVIPKNSSLSVNFTPATGNTSMSVKVAIVGFLFAE